MKLDADYCVICCVYLRCVSRVIETGWGSGPAIIAHRSLDLKQEIQIRIETGFCLLVSVSRLGSCLSAMLVHFVIGVFMHVMYSYSSFFSTLNISHYKRVQYL
jgi:hypothetical protein